MIDDCPATQGPSRPSVRAFKDSAVVGPSIDRARVMRIDGQSGTREAGIDCVPTQPAIGALGDTGGVRTRIQKIGIGRRDGQGIMFASPASGLLRTQFAFHLVNACSAYRGTPRS